MYRNCDCSYNQNDYEMDNNSCDMYEESCQMNNNCHYYPNYSDEYMCSCGFNQGVNMFPDNIMYGHSYVPNQIMNKVFTPEVGLKMGTIFPELVSPYSPGQSMETINFLKCANDVKGGCNRDDG